MRKAMCFSMVLSHLVSALLPLILICFCRSYPSFVDSALFRDPYRRRTISRLFTRFFPRILESQAYPPFLWRLPDVDV